MNVGAHLPPPIDWSVKVEHFSALNGAVECNPRHNPRMGEALRAAANFPNAAIRFLPDLREMIEQRQLHGPAGLVYGKTAAARLMGGVEEFAIHVKLPLTISRISDADWPRPLVAGKPGRLPFNDTAFAGQSIHDLKLLRAPGDSTQQPLVPCLRCFAKPGIHQRE